jgi:hypothetical protein
LTEVKDLDINTFYKARSVTTLSACLEKTGKKPEALNVLEGFKKELETRKEMAPYLMREIDSQIEKMK